jgi:hypothetical protein
MRATMLALRFLLELAALGALAYWGATFPGMPTPARAALALGAPAAAALFWGALIAPRSPARVPQAVKAVLALGVFMLAALALATRGYRETAAAFALVSLVNAALLLATAS